MRAGAAAEVELGAAIERMSLGVRRQLAKRRLGATARRIARRAAPPGWCHHANGGQVATWLADVGLDAVERLEAGGERERQNQHGFVNK